MTKARYEGFGALLSKICVYTPLATCRQTHRPLHTETVKVEGFTPVLSDRSGRPSSELLLQACSSTFLCHKFPLYFGEFRCSGLGVGFCMFFDGFVCLLELC